MRVAGVLFIAFAYIATAIPITTTTHSTHQNAYHEIEDGDAHITYMHPLLAAAITLALGWLLGATAYDVVVHHLVSRTEAKE